MCVSSLLFFSSFNMIIVELPDYLSKLGGAEYQGLIISLFTLAALISRPFSGRLTDRVGRVPVMIFGAVICVIIGFIYPLLPFVWGFLFLRFMHGFSAGFTPTGNAAYVADVVPVRKRGEAMGYLGLFNSLGMAIGPVFGSQLMIWLEHDYQWLFWASSLMAAASVLILWGLPETLVKKERLQKDHFKITKDDFFEPRAIPPALVFIFTTFSFGVVLTLIPDKCRVLDIDNKGVFFTIFTLSSLLARVLSGKASDRFGRVPVLLASTSLLAISMTMIGMAESKSLLYLGASVFGMAIGLNSPTLFAWTVDRGNIERKGRALATAYIALEFGIGMGALISGTLYGGFESRIPLSFYLSSLMALFGFGYLLVFMVRKGSEKALI